MPHTSEDKKNKRRNRRFKRITQHKVRCDKSIIKCVDGSVRTYEPIMSDENNSILDNSTQLLESNHRHI